VLVGFHGAAGTWIGPRGLTASALSVTLQASEPKSGSIRARDWPRPGSHDKQSPARQVAPIMSSTEYLDRGVSPTKDDVHRAIASTPLAKCRRLL